MFQGKPLSVWIPVEVLGTVLFTNLKESTQRRWNYTYIQLMGLEWFTTDLSLRGVESRRILSIEYYTITISTLGITHNVNSCLLIYEWKKPKKLVVGVSTDVTILYRIFSVDQEEKDYKTEVTDKTPRDPDRLRCHNTGLTFSPYFYVRDPTTLVKVK